MCFCACGSARAAGGGASSVCWRHHWPFTTPSATKSVHLPRCGWSASVAIWSPSPPDSLDKRVPKSNQTWNAQFLAGHPLFAAFEPLARSLRGPSFPSCEQLSALAEQERLRRAPSAAALRFVPAIKKPRRAKRTRLVLDELYDGSIHLRRQVPCLRHSYHDLFNALAFSAFVRSKRALHARQFEALRAWVGDAPQLPGRRTREQDALTIFDEGGVVVLLDSTMMRTWRTSQERLPLFAHEPSSGAIPLLFGHALVEHLFEGHTQIRASAVVIEVAQPLPT